MQKHLSLLLCLFLLSCCIGKDTAPAETKETLSQVIVSDVKPTISDLEKDITVYTGDTVQVDYVGYFEDGNVFDSSAGKKPLEFKVGSGQVIRGFDAAVIGMKINGTKSVRIPPEEAYGPAYTIDTAPKVALYGVENLTLGLILEQRDPDNNIRGLAQVIGMDDETVTFNVTNLHPMAGKTLFFNMTLVNITAAGG